MYKIYINETPLFLLKTNDLQNIMVDRDNTLIARYTGKAKMLLNYIDMLEKSPRFEAVILYSNDYEALIRDYKDLYKIIEAAGGLVFNQRGEMLMINRRGYWDLPKGKIDKGESKEAASVREVQEETGLNKLERGELIYESYHTYKNQKDKRILKRTFWYEMTTIETELVPQAEEDIEEAVWIHPENLIENPKKMYRSIKDVLAQKKIHF